MRKRSWGRLGAAVGVVALLAGGLVGVAAPAQAETLEECGSTWIQGNYNDPPAPSPPPAGSQPDDTVGEEWCNAKNSVFVEWDYEDRNTGGTRWLWKAMGYELPTPPTPEVCPDGGIVNGLCRPNAELPIDINCDWDAGEEFIDGEGCVTPKAPIVNEPVQKNPPPPPCWSAEALNNCPVGGALRFAAPEYAMVGVPVTMYAYASWRPDANAPSQPTNGTAVIRVDGADYSGVEFVDGVAVHPRDRGYEGVHR